MVYPLPIFLNFQVNISKCRILRISKSQILHDLYQGYPWDIFIPFPAPRAHAALGALRLLRTRVATVTAFKFFKFVARVVPFTTAMCRSSVAATDRPSNKVKFAPPKLPQPLVHLTDIPSLLARRVCCICQHMWELASPVLAELVCITLLYRGYMAFTSGATRSLTMTGSVNMGYAMLSI